MNELLFRPRQSGLRWVGLALAQLVGVNLSWCGSDRQRVGQVCSDEELSRSGCIIALKGSISWSGWFTSYLKGSLER